MKAPSLNTGSVNRFVVAIGTTHPGFLERFPEGADDPVAFLRGGVDRDEIVVVKIDPPHAERCELANGVHRIERGPHEVAERIAATVSTVQRPKVKRSEGWG